MRSGKFQLGDKKVKMRDQAASVVRVLLLTKDAISAVVTAEPHVALTWAGVLLLLLVSSLIFW